jgi:hypothetical protein
MPNHEKEESGPTRRRVIQIRGLAVAVGAYLFARFYGGGKELATIIGDTVLCEPLSRN